MTAPAADHERKFLVDESAALAFLRVIAPRVEPLIHDPGRPVSWNRTTYLDTPDLAYLRGGSRRLRVREYASAETSGAQPRLTGDCWLELKETVGILRTKSRFRAPAVVIARLLDGAELDAVRPELATCVREDRPRAVMTSWYRRTSWVVPSEGLRITLDHEVAFGPPSALGVPGLQATARVPGLILEVKHAGEVPSWLLAALGAIPAQPPLSKYRLGMELTARARPAAEMAEASP